MLRSISVAQYVVLVGGGVQMLLGVMFWAGTAQALIPAHIFVGTIVAAALLMLAIQGLRARIPVGLGVLSIVWSLLLPALGALQSRILVGPSHWIVEVIHLLVGITAMGLASFIAKVALLGTPREIRDEAGEVGAADR